MELNKQLLNYKNQTVYEVGLEREYKIFKIETFVFEIVPANSMLPQITCRAISA